MIRNLEIKLSLKYIIVFFVFIMCLLTGLNIVTSAWYSQKRLLVKSEISANEMYANKVASSIDFIMALYLDNFKYSASLIKNNIGDKKQPVQS
jgi:hypothetical protein